MTPASAKAPWGDLIGMLVGVLGGPIGMLLGLGIGAAGGAVYDASKADDEDDALTAFANSIPLGRNVIIAQTDEVSTGALDAAAASLGGVVQRRLLSDVVAELEAERQAERDAADAARKALREQKKQERSEDLHRRVEALKVAFGGGKKDDA